MSPFGKSRGVSVERRLALLVAVSLLAGCSEPTSQDDETDVVDSGTGPMLTNETAPPRLLPWERVTIYFTAEGALSFTLPDADEIVLASPSALFITGPDARVFALPAAPHAMFFMNEVVDVTLYLESDGPQVSNGGFDLGIWGGSSLGYGIDYIGTYEPATAPGEVQEVRASLPFESKRGFLVPAGESIQFLVAGPIGRETGQPRMQVGGEQASSIEITLANYTVDPLNGTTGLSSETLDGELTGSTPFFCPPVPGADPGGHDIVIHPQAAWVHLVIDATAEDYDVDIALSDGEMVVAQTSTPSGHEMIFMGAETLAGLQGKTLRLVVTPCGLGPSDYEGTLAQGLGGDGTMMTPV